MVAVFYTLLLSFSHYFFAQIYTFAAEIFNQLNKRMKKIVSVVMFMVALVSCSPTDYYQDPAKNEDNDVKEILHAEDVLGIKIDPNQDWCTTVAGEVNVTVDHSVKKVQLLAEVCEVEEDCPSYVTRNTMVILNEADVNGRSSLTMSYDAPKENLGLYMAFISDTDYRVAKVKNDAVSIADVPQAARTRTHHEDYVLPQGTFAISNIKPSYAAERGWVKNEKLYELSDDDYATLKMSLPAPMTDLDADFKDMLRKIVFACFPNGRDADNLPLVQASGKWNNSFYPITTGETDPIVVTPLYKCDNPLKYGNEVYNSELYYYYFPADDVKDMNDDQARAYLEKLPKYKALPFDQCFGYDEDDVVKHHGSFALLYFGDSNDPAIGTEGTFQFPQGYKIGFMVRANTDWDKGKKKGEVYADGRLNGSINTSKDYNFSTSAFSKTDPRAAWLTINGRDLLCWESGTDRDFNDIILEVDGSIEEFIVTPPYDHNNYFFLFEDTPNGDYDMNDIVIKAVREDETHVGYYIMACGAYDELFIKNINCGVITDNAEVHSLFGQQTTEVFINTEKDGLKCKAVYAQRTVDQLFSFLETKNQPYIYDKTINHTTKLALKGQSPHGIMLSYAKFKYPLEKTPINEAFPKFNEWGENAVNSTKWFKNPYKSKVY